MLSAEQEAELAESLRLLARWAFGFSREETINIVAEFVQDQGLSNCFTDGVPGEDWIIGFMKRHPTLTLRKPEQLKKTRLKAITNQEVLKDFFHLFRTLCVENNIFNDPSRIYNVDESGFPLDASRTKVLCEKGIRQLFNVIGGSGREQITVNGCCSADGKMLPPYVVYQAAQIRLKWTEDGPVGTK